MNIFYLDTDPAKAAEMQIDKHVVKMVLESAQLLCTCHRVLDGEHGYKVSAAGRRLQTWTHPDPVKEATLYKSQHFNHPCSLWLRESVENYNWLYEHFIALGEEYTRRYNKTHLSITKLKDILKEPPKNIPQVPFTEPKQATLPEYYIEGNPIEGYHKYYQAEKLPLGNENDRKRYIEKTGRIIEDKLPF